MSDRASDWLSDWISEHINAPGYDEEKAHFEKDAELCLAHAEAEGLKRSDVVDAAGGDLAQYLMDQQNALTDAVVRERIADDD